MVDQLARPSWLLGSGKPGLSEEQAEQPARRGGGRPRGATQGSVARPPNKKAKGDEPGAEEEEDEDDMDLGEEGGQQRSRRGGGKRGGHTKTFVKILKALCNLMQRMRDVESVILICFIIAVSSPVAKGLRETIAAYDKNCKRDGRGHTHGPPHSHLWLRLLQELAVDPKVSEKPDLKKTIEDEIGRLAQEGFEEVDRGVKLVRVTKTFDKDKKRLILAPQGSPVYKVVAALVLTGAQQKLGRAPVGALESELSRELERLLE